MKNSQKQLIANLKEQLQNRYNQYAEKSYILAIQSITNSYKKPLTLISGSSTLYNIDPINLFVEQHTLYPSQNQ